MANKDHLRSAREGNVFNRVCLYVYGVGGRYIMVDWNRQGTLPKDGQGPPGRSNQEGPTSHPR